MLTELNPKEKLILEGLRYQTLRKFNLLFEMKNPYKSKFRCIQTESSYKSKWSYIQKLRSRIILCNDYLILLEIRKELDYYLS